jgi:hypothetical protein
LRELTWRLQAISKRQHQELKMTAMWHGVNLDAVEMPKIDGEEQAGELDAAEQKVIDDRIKAMMNSKGASHGNGG